MKALIDALRDEAEHRALLGAGDGDYESSPEDRVNSQVAEVLLGLADKLDTEEARARRARSIDFLMSVRECMRKEGWIGALEDLFLPVMTALEVTPADLDAAKAAHDEHMTEARARHWADITTTRWLIVSRPDDPDRCSAGYVEARSPELAATQWIGGPHLIDTDDTVLLVPAERVVTLGRGQNWERKVGDGGS